MYALICGIRLPLIVSGARCLHTSDILLMLQKQVIGSMAMVRNSVGSECYVSDEIITSRAGVRIRVGNTDAEGRMAMADVLCLMKERAVKEVSVTSVA